MQILPVLCIAGAAKAPSVSMTVSTKARQKRQEVGVQVDVRVRNTTTWVSLPFVKRLHGFLNPFILHLAVQGTDR